MHSQASKNISVRQLLPMSMDRVQQLIREGHRYKLIALIKLIPFIQRLNSEGIDLILMRRSQLKELCAMLQINGPNNQENLFNVFTKDLQIQMKDYHLKANFPPGLHGIDFMRSITSALDNFLQYIGASQAYSLTVDAYNSQRQALSQFIKSQQLQLIQWQNQKSNFTKRQLLYQNQLISQKIIIENMFGQNESKINEQGFLSRMISEKIKKHTQNEMAKSKRREQIKDMEKESDIQQEKISRKMNKKIKKHIQNERAYDIRSINKKQDQRRKSKKGKTSQKDDTLLQNFRKVLK